MMPGFTPGQDADANRRIETNEVPRADESSDFLNQIWNARGRVCNEKTVKDTDAKTFIL
jgi:hypothetical protein